MIHTLTIPGWHPTTLNALLNCHWRQRARLKKADREMVGYYFRESRIPRATGKRRVLLRITMAPRMRTPDPDAHLKVAGDCLVACGALVDDRKEYIEWLPVEYRRGEARQTEIVLEDVE